MRTFFAVLGIFTGLTMVGCPTNADDDDVGGDCTNFSGHEFPDVVIEAPADGSNFTAGEVLNFVVTVTDADSDLTAMEMVAEDTIDNSADLIDVTVPAPDSDGRSAFTIAYDDLGQGAHTVRISAMDTDGCESSDSVVVCLDEPNICN
jgi:hypothetical protein